MPIRLVISAICAGLAVMAAALPAAAQTWPQRNVRFIVPLGPGSGVDIAHRLATRLGLVEPALPWHTDRTRIAELAGALGTAVGEEGTGAQRDVLGLILHILPAARE